MINSTPSLYLYDASAGSGKTFTLVKEYLKKLLLAEQTDYYKKILAITFTNKAVGEMKERIVDQLVAFSNESSIKEPDDMLQHIAREIQLSYEQIHTKSKQILRHLLHDYSGFSVETIDSFNHRIIRTFAKDLKLNANFEVTLDTELLLEEAVDRLIAQAGKDYAVTDYLLQYTNSQLIQDKSWHIRREIIKTAKLLISENHKESIEKLKNHDLDEFRKFTKKLKDSIDKNFKQAKLLAQKTLELLKSMHIPNDAFDRSSYPKFLDRVIDRVKEIKFDKKTKWHTEILNGEYAYYKKSTDDIHKQQIDSIKNELSSAFIGIKACIDQNAVYTLIRQELLPMALINLVANERNAIQEEQNVLLIGDFNHLLHEQVKDQPAPFIYERLGDRYRHFFIDEFQDTSKLQWENMMPLLDNALSQGFESGLPGSVMLVGDAKQSIYRWRGGYPEQFINLTQDELPFQISEEQRIVKHLDTNYRSCENIIDFNNQFFTQTANVLQDETYRKLYLDGNQQKTNSRKGGYIQIDRLAKPKEDETTNSLHQNKVIEIIQTLKERDALSLSDICILVRKNVQGILISEILSEYNIPFISSETLLLKNSKEVNALLNCLRLLLFPADKESRVKLCYFIYENLDIKEDKHDFLSKLTKPENIQDFLNILATYGVSIDIQAIAQASLYQTFEILIEKLEIDKLGSAYLFSFMDFVHNYEQTQATTKHLFFDYWESKADKLSIPSSKQSEAIQIMTIHKAKGLEFPMVIFPFGNNKLGDLSKTSDWLPWHEEGAFDEVYVPIKDSLLNFNEDYEEQYKELYEKEVLDELNNIYVAFTRASRELYIITDNHKKNSNTYLLCDLLQAFVENKKGSIEEGEVYSIGEHTFPKDKEPKEVNDQTIEPVYTLTDPNLLDIVTAKADLWDSKIEEAITYGTELHDILEQIITKEDASSYFKSLELQEAIPIEKLHKLQSTVEAIVHHEDLQHLFSTEDTVRTELDIVTSDKQIRRMDRLNFHNDKSVTLVDYKTGEAKNDDIIQIQAYAQALGEMGIQLKEKLLVYINDTAVIVNKV